MVLCYPAAMWKRSLLLLLLPLSAAHAEGGSWTLTAADWAQPRTGEMILQQPALQEAMKAYRAEPGSHLQLRYPGGDEGSLWVNELKAWLVAMGLASSKIESLPGSGRADAIDIVVMQKNR